MIEHEPGNVPGKNRKRFRKPAVFLTFITIGVLSVILILTKQTPLWSGAGADDPLTVHRVYNYRVVAAQYDSMDVQLMYGELFAINGGDSTHINTTPITGPTSYCTTIGTKGYCTASSTETIEKINGQLIWKNFTCDDETEISLFKVATYSANPNALNLQFPDTLAWTLRLHNAADGSLIATLDSTVLFRRMTGFDFPNHIGFSTPDTWEHKSWIIGDIAVAGSTPDSVYLTAEVNSFFGKQDNFWIEDHSVENKKYSDYPVFHGKQTQPTDESTIHTGVFNLEILPNPVKGGQQTSVTLRAYNDFTGRLVLINPRGEVAHEFQSGNFTPDTYSYKYRPEETMPSGMYYLCLADQNNNVVTHLELVIQK